jgi:hypothetical protein
MLDIARRYCADHPTDEDAMRAFAADLMRGDPASFKQGYTRENAVLTTAEAFGADRGWVDTLVPS